MTKTSLFTNIVGKLHYKAKLLQISGFKTSKKYTIPSAEIKFKARNRG